MARERLTTKVAGEIAGDVYTINNPEHETNDPKIDEYAKGDPSAWGEDVATDTATLPKKDESSRDKEIRMASEAVKTARQLEQKAVKCIVAAQRMLPGASDEVIEAQAADLMELPESSLKATLARQEKLAQEVLAKAEEVAKEVAEEVKEEKNAMTDEEKEEFAEKMQKARKNAADAQKKVEELEKEAAKSEDEEEEKEAAKSEDEEEEKEASKSEDEEEEKEASKSEDEEETKEASEGNLLDEIFSSVQASDNKKGASSLSGLVSKEASSKGSELDGLWGSIPDVSHIFG